MQPRFGAPITSLRPTDATRAAAICRQLIELVEGTILGRTSCNVFVEDAQPIANQLTQLLSQMGCELDDRLTWFRDCLLPSGDYEAQAVGDRLLCDLGLGVPVFVDDEEHLHLHYRLTVEWLSLMRDFAQTLREASVVRNRPRPSHGKGGRPKTKEVLRLEKEVQAFYEAEANRLHKQGMETEMISKRLSGLTRYEVLKQLRVSPYWASSRVGDEAMLKRIGRTSAWQQLHSPAGMVSVSAQAESIDAAEASPRLDNGWAVMNQLHVRRGPRTKPNSELVSGVSSCRR